MSAIFGICGNESQPDLQIVEKLATPLRMIRIITILELAQVTLTRESIETEIGRTENRNQKIRNNLNATSLVRTGKELCYWL